MKPSSDPLIKFNDAYCVRRMAQLLPILSLSLSSPLPPNFLAPEHADEPDG